MSGAGARQHLRDEVGRGHGERLVVDVELGRGANFVGMGVEPVLSHDEAVGHDLAVDEGVVAGAAVEGVVPGPPISTSSPSPPAIESSPSPPIRTSSPIPPSMVSAIDPAVRPDASTTSLPSPAETVSRSSAVQPADSEMVARPTTSNRTLAGDHDDVVARRAIYRDVVGGAIAAPVPGVRRGR